MASDTRTNTAAWLTKSGAALEVKSAPYPEVKPNQIIVRTNALAINPVDWCLQYVPFIFPHLKLPIILGADVAGSVVEVGSQVTRFKVGDRVIGHAVGTDKRSNDPAERGFQNFVVLRDNLVSQIPSTMSYEDACVIPLGLSTAACGLYMKDYLGLSYPSLAPKGTGETLIVWGASTSVGCNAVQLAHASGYDVIATCSPKNFEYIKSLGAKSVFDYRSKTVVADIIKALEGTTCVGAIAICDGSTEACISILSVVKGRKFIVQMSMPLASSDITTLSGRVAGLSAVMRYNVSLWFNSKIKGVQVKFVFGSDLMENEVGKLVYQDFLPEALAQGKYIAAPSPLVVGNGLDKLQEAMDVNRKGMSARKAVVTLM